jgi:uncharacterized protein (TIGR02284 family)
MSTYTETIGNKLNALLEKNQDAEKGFMKAAEHTKNQNLKAYFESKSKERNTFSSALKSEIMAYGQKSGTDGSTTGDLHRAWMDIKALFAVHNDEAMLEAAITGEKASLEEYQDVVTEANLPPSTRALLTQQMNKIKTGLDTIKHLEDVS